MENAVKALIIAASVLIGIIIISLGVTMYNVFNKQAKGYNTTVSTIEVDKYNSHFLTCVGRSNISANEVATVLNLSRYYNQKTIIKVTNLPSPLQDFSSGEFDPESFLSVCLDKTFTCRGETIAFDENGIIKYFELKMN